MCNCFKKKISVLLVATLIITNTGFATLADYISSESDINDETRNTSELSHKYFDELKNDNQDDIDIIKASDSEYNFNNDIYEDSKESGEDKASESKVLNNDAETIATESDINESTISDTLEEDLSKIQTDSVDINISATQSDTTEQKNDATTSEINIEIVDPTDFTNENEINSINEEIYGTIPDSNKYEWQSNWWTDLGFTDADKRDITKIVFSPIKFGNYWQDASDYGNEATAGKEPIVWRVLKTQTSPDRTLIMSEEVLFSHRFDASQYNGWIASELCDYLNNNWINDAFTANEQAQINTALVGNTGFASPKEDGSGNCKIFILSSAEVAGINAGGYFVNEDDRVSLVTGYKSKFPGSVGKGRPGTWWLRSPGNTMNDASGINGRGEMSPNANVAYSAGGVRPALWVNMSVADLDRAGSTINLTQVKTSKIKTINGRNVVSAYIMNNDNSLQVEFLPGYQIVSGDLNSFFSSFPNLTEVQGLDNFDWENVTNISAMFKNCPNLRVINMSEGFGKNATNVESMFENTGITAYPTNLTLTNAENMKNLFKGCDKLESITLPAHFGQNATDMTGLFEGTKLKSVPANLDCMNVATVSRIFANLKSTSLDFSNFTNINFGQPNVDASEMFADSTTLASISVASNYAGLPNNIITTNMFMGCNNLAGGGGSSPSASVFGIDDTYARIDLGGVQPGYFTPADANFYNNAMITIDSTWANNLNKTNIKKIKFKKDKVMESVDSSIDVPLTINGNLIVDCKGYLKESGETIVIHFANAIPNLKTVVSWDGFFKDFTNLESIEGLDIIDTSVVTSMKEVFKDCEHLRTVALGDLNIKNVTTVESVFENCSALTTLTGNVASFSSLRVSKNAFKGCSSLPVFSFDVCDTPTLTDVSGMFEGCTSLTTIYADDNFAGLPASVTSSTNMFKNCINLKGGEGFSYNVTAPITDGSVANVDYGGIKPGYFTILDTSKYASALFTLPTNWYDLHASAVKPKSEIKKIKFYNDVTGVGSYNQYFYMSDTDGTRFFIEGDTVKIHYGSRIPKLKVNGDWSGFFKDFTSLTSIEGLETEIDTTEVTNMSELFSGCKSLRIINFNPNTSKVTNMSKVFYNCASLSEVHIGTQLKLNNVTNLESAFENCSELKVFDIGVASFSNIANLKNAFKNCKGLTSFKFDVCALNNLTTTEGMFEGCSNLRTIYVSDSFQGLPNITSTDMFKDCTSLVGGQGFAYSNGVHPITDGRVARVDYGGIMPGYYTIYGTPEQIRQKYSTAQFNLPSTWFDGAIAAGVNKDSVTKIKFYNDNVSGTNIGVGRYDGSYLMSTVDNSIAYYENERDASGNPTGNVIAKIHFGNLLPNLKVGADFSGFFKDFKNVKTIEGIENLNLSAVEDMSELFSGCENLESITITPDISHVRDMDRIFYNCKNLVDVDLGVNVNLGNVETLESAFENCEKLTTRGLIIRSTVPLNHIRSFKNAFKNCKLLTSFGVNAGSADTLVDLEGVFAGCESLVNVNAQSMNLTNVTTTKDMFSGCKNLTTFTVGNNSNLATVSNLERMFYNCEKLTSLPGIHITSDRITTMKSMFAGCSSIGQVGIVSAKTDNLVSDGLVDMFLNCKKLTTVVFGSGFVLGNAEDLTNMFSGCESLTYVNLLHFTSNNISNVTDMFKNNKKLELIIASSSFAVKGKTGDEMFLGCESLVGGEGTKYSKASVSSLYASVDEGDKNPGYFSWGNVTLTFLPGDGATGTMNPMELVRGTSVTIKCGFTKEGYNFKNWVDTNGNTYDSKITVIKSLTLTALWEEIPKPSPQPPSGGGSSPGGGGGGRGATIPMGNIGLVNIDFVVHTPISLEDYKWECDEKGEKIGIEIRKDSSLGKALVNSTRHITRWQALADDAYIKLKNGFYNIEYLSGNYYFAFDNEAKLRTGFIETTSSTEHVYIDITNSQFIEANSVPSAKYFLYDGVGLFRGIIWNQPITVKEILYTFDEQGRVIKEEKVDVNNLAFGNNVGSNWQYDPIKSKWKYYNVDATGNGDYYKNGVYPISYLGKNLYYSFDSDGYMETGLKEIGGDTYYFQEEGDFAGALYTGQLIINRKIYEFDASGKMVRAMTGTEK